MSEKIDYSLEQMRDQFDSMVGDTDYNLFFNIQALAYNWEWWSNWWTNYGRRVFPLDEWQKMGFDRHSVIADPMFMDPEHDDYRLQPESPAFKLGFQPIDIEKIGLRDKERR